MSAYVTIMIHKMKDEAAFAEYRKSAAGAIAKHGGALVLASWHYRAGA